MLFAAGIVTGCGLFGPEGVYSSGYCTRAGACDVSRHELVKHIAHIK